jgi:hypothetical protein
MNKLHTVQAFARKHGKKFLKKYPDCGFNESDLLQLVNLAFLQWSDPTHKKLLRKPFPSIPGYPKEEPKNSGEILLCLFLRTPLVASKWIQLVLEKWEGALPQYKALMKGLPVLEILDRQTELLDKAGVDPKEGKRDERTIYRNKKELLDGELDF